MAVNFVVVDRETPDRFPATVQEYLPEDHLARFVVEIVDRLDLSRLVAAYAGTGSRPYHPAMLVALLFYGCANPPSRPSHHRRLPQALSRGVGGAVHRGAARCAGDGAAQARHRQSRRD